MRWFLPEGTPRPSHLPPVSMTGAVQASTGPSGVPGLVLGGVYLADEPGWVEIDGWWFNPTGIRLESLLRPDALPGVDLPGTAGMTWLIPSLLRPSPRGLVWDAPQVLGPQGWQPQPPPEPYQSLALAVARVINASPEEKARMSDDEVTDLALRIVCSNYFLDPREVRRSQWLLMPMVPEIFAIVAGLRTVR